MVPRRRRRRRWAASTPAPAGMVPHGADDTGRTPGCSPRERDGPTLVILAERRAKCSPRQRGWSHLWGGPHFPVQVLPARAGMVPGMTGRTSPAPRAPRARRDGPAAISGLGIVDSRSLQERGWSQLALELIHCPAVLPARAGVVPERAAAETRRAGAPRARGDGPLAAAEVVTTSVDPKTQQSKERVVFSSQHRSVADGVAKRYPGSTVRASLTRKSKAPRRRPRIGGAPRT
jgi:hypothetical protein